MNIQTVAINLRNTIAGKEKYLAEWNNADITETADRIHRATIVGMLTINIDELTKILKDVEQCKPEVIHTYDSDPYDGPIIKMFRDD